jgi:SsrA-binding protein
MSDQKKQKNKDNITTKKVEDYKSRPFKAIMHNRKALYEYEVIQKIEAGIVLVGTEVKSLRAGKCNLQDSYAGFVDKHSFEIVLYNLQISEYEFGNIQNHSTKRPRKLLINHTEAKKLKTAINEKGYTIVPTMIYFSGHLVKIEIALVKPKKLHDKRENTKDREVKRTIERALKG